MSIRSVYRDALRASIKKQKREGLSNHDFTLFCNNCVGGMIYSTLGEKFNSPTINCFFPNLDAYIDFLKNLNHYLTCEFTEKRVIPIP